MAALVGGTLAAPLAATGQALADGAIGPEHVRVLVDVFDRCPHSVSPEVRVEAERTLLELAAQATPDAVRAADRRLIAYWQAEDKPPTDEDLVTLRREFRYQRTGAMVFSGRLDAEMAAAPEGLFGPLAKPRPATDGVRDPRTTAERQGDAFAEIIDSAARADDMTVQGGERAVLTVTLSLAELEGRVRRALVDVPGHTSVDQLRRLACEAEVVRDLRQQGRTALPRPITTHGHQSPTPRTCPARPRLCVAGLRSATQVLPGAPRRRVGTWRTQRHRQVHPALRPSPPHTAPHRLADAQDAQSAHIREHRRYYKACHRQYRLTVPFAQRFFELARPADEAPATSVRSP